MNDRELITLTKYWDALNEAANESKKEFPKPYFDYAGIIPAADDETSQYDSSPTNTRIFAWTGGDGVHYSILRMSDLVQPVVMTVPMNFGNSIHDYNRILGENLNEFLSLGYYNGWFHLEELCYNEERAIDFYSKENYYHPDGQIQFVEKMRTKLGYKHVPLNSRRLKELELLYFHKLQFKPEFCEQLKPGQV